MKCSRLLRFASRPSVKLLKAVIGIFVNGQRHSHYFFSAAPGAGEVAGCAGRSELNMSVPTFHFPLAFFSQTSQYLPLSLLPSVIVISYVPIKTAISPDLATSTRVVFQLISCRLSRNPF